MPGRRPPLALIFGVTITGIMANSLVSPAIPDILDDFGVPDSRAGLLVASASLPGIVVAPLIGVLADRFGRRAVLVPCLAVFGLAGLGAAAAPTFWALVAARLTMGLGSAGMINLAVVLIGDHWEGERRTHLIGRNAAVLTIGLAVMPLASGTLTDLVGWRLALAPYGLGLLTAVAAHRMLDPTRPDQVEALGPQLREAGAILRRPVILGVLASGFLLFVIIFGLYLTTLPLHLEDRFGLSAGARGVVLGVPAVTSTIVAFNLGALRRRAGLRALLVAGSLLFLGAFLAMGAAGALPFVVAAAALYGLGEGAFIPTLQDVAVSAAPDRHRGAVLAVWVGAARTGQTTGPLLAGALIGATSSGTTLVLGSLLALVVLAIQLAGVIDPRPVAEPAGTLGESRSVEA